MIKRIFSNYSEVLFGWKVWIASFTVFWLFQLDAGMPISFNNHHWDVLRDSYDFKIVLISCIYFGMYICMMCITATIGFGLQFHKEWKAGVVPQLVSKMGLKKYSTLYVLLAMLSGGLINLTGYGLYAWYMGRRVLYINTMAVQTEVHDFAYVFSLSDESGIQYVVIMGILYSVVGAVASVIALYISTLTENKYLVMFSPYLIFRSYTELCKVIRIPDNWRIDYYLFGRIDIGDSFSEFIAIIVIVLFMVAVIGQHFFKMGVRGRLINGKY